MPNKPAVVMRRPLPTEYNAYYGGYVDLVPETDIFRALREQRESTLDMLEGAAEKIEHRYAPEKWTLRQVFGHVLDMEWVFTVRALHFARAVAESMPGVEQDDAMRVSNFEDQSWTSMLTQYGHVRSASILLFEGFDDAAWSRTGIASGNPVSVRALAWITVGHQRHHMNMIRERYLV
jgi:hypothetical protein